MKHGIFTKEDTDPCEHREQVITMLGAFPLLAIIHRRLLILREAPRRKVSLLQI